MPHATVYDVNADVACEKGCHASTVRPYYCYGGRRRALSAVRDEVWNEE